MVDHKTRFVRMSVVVIGDNGCLRCCNTLLRNRKFPVNLIFFFLETGSFNLATSERELKRVQDIYRSVTISQKYSYMYLLNKRIYIRDYWRKDFEEIKKKKNDNNEMI